nr:Hexuronate transporter [Klebsiella pneumoniae]
MGHNVIPDGLYLSAIGLRIYFRLDWFTYWFLYFALARSFANMAHALAINWQSLAFCRGLLGLSESAAIPAGIKATSEWFPSKERGIAGGLFNIGTSLGAMLAPPIVVWAIIYMHWQFAFIFTGSFGLIFAFYGCFISPTRKHKWISEEEKQYIAAGQEKELQSDGDKRPPLRALLKQRNFWGIAMTRFLSDPVWGTLSFWLPLYLIRVRHLPLKEIAMFARLPFRQRISAAWREACFLIC